MDLFDKRGTPAEHPQPLAERMRPRTLAEFAGQTAVLGKDGFLGRAIAADRVPSLLLWGPPGCGKTTLGRIIANATRSHFEMFSAVLGGLKEIRQLIEQAERRKAADKRTILFIDEIHRFNKAQQDALLPHVERGTVTMIGATTENPSFEVIAPLMSRCRLIALDSLSREAVLAILKRAVGDAERGLGPAAPAVDEEALGRIADTSWGDGRRALNVLESAAAYAASVGSGRVTVSLLGKMSFDPGLLYDRAGEEHYNIASAFIKSLRGSDPDAAVYWMARMVESGEEPRFILRRMVIFASEDIGNADPRALQVAVDAMRAFEFVGMPEGVLPMTQAAVYLALAPKSNSVLRAYRAAAEDAKGKGALPVPVKLRNAPTRLMKGLGYGGGYRYPHDFEGAVAEGEVYLPGELEGRVYYRPSDRGEEREAGRGLSALRGKGGTRES